MVLIACLLFCLFELCYSPTETKLLQENLISLLKKIYETRTGDQYVSNMICMGASTALVLCTNNHTSAI